MLCDKTAEQFKTFSFLFFIFYILYVFVHMLLQDCSANKPTFIYYCVMFCFVVLCCIVLISEPNFNKVCTLYVT